jgi:hypothetical protein
VTSGISLIDRAGSGGMLGAGLMLASQDVTPEQDERFNAWYTHEHLPERLAVDGVRRATRYVRAGASAGRGLRYLAIYEARDPAVFASADYLRQADAPSPLTRAVIADRVRAGTATGRSVLGVRRSLGLGVGRSLALVDLGIAPAARLSWYDDEVQPALASDPQVCGVHLACLDERATDAKRGTADGRTLGDTRTLHSVVLVTGTGENVAELADRVLGSLAGRMFAGRDVTGYAYLVSMVPPG